MAGFDGKPRQANEDENPETISRNSKHGLLLFAVYLIFYAGFMGLNAFKPEVMAQVLPGGINIALWYGMGLIVVALLLALVYMYLCAERDLPPGASRSPKTDP